MRSTGHVDVPFYRNSDTINGHDSGSMFLTDSPS